MPGKPSTNFTFDVEPERTLHAELKQARKARLAASEAKIPVSEQEIEIELFEHSDRESDKEREDPIMVEPQERLLGDYG